MTAIRLLEQPSTYGVEWERLARLRLALIEANVREECPWFNQIFWTAGVFYGLRETNWPAITADSQMRGKEESFERICRSTARRLERIYRSYSVARYSESIRMNLGCEGTPSPSSRMAWTFLEMHFNPRDWLPRRAIAFVENEPRCENRLRFYFGMGVESILNFANQSSISAYVKDGGRFLLPDDPSGSKRQKIIALVSELFPNESA